MSLFDRFRKSDFPLRETEDSAIFFGRRKPVQSRILIPRLNSNVHHDRTILAGIRRRSMNSGKAYVSHRQPRRTPFTSTSSNHATNSSDTIRSELAAFPRPTLCSLQKFHRRPRNSCTVQHRTNST